MRRIVVSRRPSGDLIPVHSHRRLMFAAVIQTIFVDNYTHTLTTPALMYNTDLSLAESLLLCRRLSIVYGGSVNFQFQCA